MRCVCAAAAGVRAEGVTMCVVCVQLLIVLACVLRVLQCALCVQLLIILACMLRVLQYALCVCSC